jgi:cytochrome d ubiquinol oxidase subunit II
MQTCGLLVISVIAGIASLLLLWRRRFTAVLVTAALTVAGVLWGWGVGQFLYLLRGVTFEQASVIPQGAQRAVIALVVAAVMVASALWWLYATFQCESHQRD